MALDYSFKPTVDMAAIAGLIQRKPVLEQNMALQQQQIENDKLDRFTKITGMATQMTQNMMAFNQENQTKQLMSAYSMLAAQPIPQPKMAETATQGKVQTMQPTEMPSGQMQTLTPQEAQSNKTSQLQSLGMALASRMNPEAVGKQMAEYGSGLNKPMVPAFQTKQGVLNNKPLSYVIDPKEGVPRDMTPQHTPIQGDIQPVLMNSPTAEIRKQQLISTLNTKAATAFDPAKWKQGTTAGKSAQVVANAQSALNLGQQMRSGQVPITASNMATLSADVNRVIAQSGQTSEQARSELVAKTGYSKLADAISFYTNNPTDQKTGAFVDVMMKEMNRQKDMRQNIVNQTLSRNLPELNQLKRISPEDWENHIKANGLDLESAKKGKLQFTKDGINSLTGENLEQPSAPGSATNGATSIDALAQALGLPKKGR